MGRRKNRAKKSRPRSPTGESSAPRAPTGSGYQHPVSEPAPAASTALGASNGIASAMPPFPSAAQAAASLPSGFALPTPPEPRAQDDVTQEELDAMMRDYCANAFRRSRESGGSSLPPEVVPLANVLAKRAATEAARAEAIDKASRLDRGAPTEITAQAWDASAYTTEELRDLRERIAKGIPR